MGCKEVSEIGWKSGREVREKEVIPRPAPLAVASLRCFVFVSSE